MTHNSCGKLRALFARAKLPASPALAAQILELSNNPDSTVEQFAKLIQLDPGLTTRLLRMTNSAACAQRSPVTTIPRAVMLLGLNRVRTLSLGFQLVSHLDRLGKCPFDMRAFWQQSVLRAVLARELADKAVPACAEEAFLIGLLQDCGILLLVQLLGKPYGELYGSGNLSPTAFHTAEKERFGHSHVEAMAAMAHGWKLPEAITGCLSKHHTPRVMTEDAGDLERLCAVSYVVGSIRLADGLRPDSHEPSLREYVSTHLQLDEADVQACIDRAAAAYGETAPLLADFVPADFDVTDLLSQANEQLTMSVHTEVSRSVLEQETLKVALGEYRERAARDPLTGLLNRGALTEELRESVALARDRGDSLTLLFADIDNFKRINDQFGHDAGDEVLKQFAAILCECTTNGGIVGRFGGEEFVVAVRTLAVDAARRLADELVSRVRRASFAGIDPAVPVTCSVGAVFCRQCAALTAEELVTMADQLMYAAKRAGKDRAHFSTASAGKPFVFAECARETLEACANALEEVAARVEGETPEAADFERIAQELNRTRPQRFVDMRKQARKELIVPCRITAMMGATLELVAEGAYVRNISTGGIGLLTTRGLRRGQPVEIAILVGDKPRLYVAGLVAFCRHVEDLVHEVGIQLFAHADYPLLSPDPHSAIRERDWVAHSLECISDPVSMGA